MRVLAISADRSKRGVLHAETPAFKRQVAYAKRFGNLDIIVFSRRSDEAKPLETDTLSIRPTASWNRFWYVYDAMRLAEKLPKPDVVTVQDSFEAGFIGWWIAQRLGVPLHVQVHTDFLSPEYCRLSLLNRARVWISRFVLRRAARVRVVSESIKLDLERRYHLQVPVSVLPIFIDLEHFRFAMPTPALSERFLQFPSKLLVVSRLEPEKDVERAMRAFAEYAPLTSCLIIVGDGSLRVRLENLSQAMRIRHRLFFEGEQDPAPYYKIADVVLFTSKYDGYGLVIAEALAAGTAVISTDVGAARELGAIVASNTEEFGEKIVERLQGNKQKAHLSSYPYKNFEAYIRAYCEDISACAVQK